MGLNWSTTDKEGLGHGIKVLLYGESGVGKTTALATAPSPIIISAEAGLLPLRGKKIPVLNVENVQDVRDALEWCENNAVSSGIKTVCVDSVSEIAEVFLSEEKVKTKDGRAVYGNMSENVIDIIKKFRNLKGVHVVIVAKQTTVADPITGGFTTSPLAPGKIVGPALPYLVDLVFNMATDRDENGKIYHYIRTHAAHNSVAKDRSGNLDEIEYPDLSNIFNKILNQ